jgi:HEAT repeat protein
MRPIRTAIVLCLSILSLSAEELPKAEGVDVIRTAKVIANAVRGPESSVAHGKAWENDIAALTDSRPEVHTQAMAALIRRGPVVIPDLTVLAKDQDPGLRMRVVAVLASIGGEDATREILVLSKDSDIAVVEMATLGLGKARGAGAFERLVDILNAPNPHLRQAAARGLGMLGDVRGLGVLCGYARDRDDLVRRDMRENLARLATNAEAIPTLVELIVSRTGTERLALIDTTGGISDPRLSPVLATILTTGDLPAMTIAAHMLAVNGDSRAVGALCQIAGHSRDALLRDEAASTLRRLTGHTAAAGVAWELWWRDHAAEVAALEPRDRLLAELHAPSRIATAAEMAGIPLDSLNRLIDGALGQGAAWWPARAFAALAADVPARWTAPLVARIDDTLDHQQRVRLIVLLDELNDQAATAHFQRFYDNLGNQPAVKIAAMGPERLAIKIALERRGVQVR